MKRFGIGVDVGVGRRAGSGGLAKRTSGRRQAVSEERCGLRSVIGVRERPWRGDQHR